MSRHPIMKKMCRGCPYNYGDESTEMAYNLGCLPSQFEIYVDCEDHNTAWACHSTKDAVCAGYAEEFPERVDLDLEIVEGIHP